MANQHIVYSARDLLSLVDDPQRWIVPDLIQKSSRVLMFGEGGAYKCRVMGQRVLLADGREQAIEELEGRTVRIRSFNPVTGDLVDEEAQVRPNGISPVISVWLDSGRRLRLTPNEPVMTAKGWIEAGALQPGLFLHGISFTPEPSTPWLIPQGLAYILGVMLGDGACSHGSGTRFTCMDAGLLHAVHEAGATNGFTVTPDGARSGAYNLCGAAGAVEEFGLRRKTSRSKRVPEELFAASTADVADFLAGYWDADGSWTWGRKRHALFTSVSHELLLGVQSLLLRIGCRSLLREHRGTYKYAPYTSYTLDLHGASAIRFMQAVHVRSDKGARAIQELQQLESTDYEERTERVPAIVARAILKPIGSKFLHRHMGVTFEYNCATWTRRKVQAISAFLYEFAARPRAAWPRIHSPVRLMSPDELRARAQALRDLTDARVWWDKVVRVEQESLALPTWSLHSGKYNTYVCEDIVTHNSCLAFDLCVAIASGGLLIKQLPIRQHGPVIINSTESSIYDNKNRLLSHMRAHAVNPADVRLHYCQQPFCLDDAQDITELEQCIQHIQPVVVVLDPLDSFFSGDENSAKETKALRRTVDRLIDEYKCTFLIIHHQTNIQQQGGGGKGKEQPEPKAKPRGSSAWAGWADAILHVKCKKQKLGLPTEIEVVTVEAMKQRNGPKGHMFSAVPFIDRQRAQTDFAYYNGVDAAGVARAYYRHHIYRVLTSTTEPMTNGMIGDAIGVRPEKLTEVFEELERDGLIAKDAEVTRAFGPEGSRVRTVSAWRSRAPMNVVDLAAIMVKDEEIELQQYTLDPQQPGTSLVDNTDDGGVREAGTG